MKSIVKRAVMGKGKSRGAVWCGVVLGFLVAVAGCERLEPVEIDTSLVCKDITVSDCKSTSKSNDEDENEDESTVEVTYNGKYLHITHKDILLNCVTAGVDVIISVDGNIIELNIIEKIPTGGLMAACLCPVDISYSVGEFEEGTYLLIIKPPYSNYNKQYSQTVVF